MFSSGRYAEMRATGGVIANEVFVTRIQPLREGEEASAMAFAVPINAKGLKILSQKSYEEGATSVFDNPLASRFDENDAVLYFDDVRVPWDRVFVSRNIAMCQKQFRATPAHVFHNYQSQTRLMVKMRFLVGIARRIAETNGVVNFPQVRGLLGSLAAQNTIVDALVQARISSRIATLCTLPKSCLSSLCPCPRHPSRTRWKRHDQAAVLHSRLCKLRVKAWRFDR